MKPVRLLIAALLLAGLGGALWYSNKKEAAKANEPAKDAPPHLLAVPADTVKQIEIQRRGEPPTIVVFNQSGKWDITQPKPLPADALAVADITSATSKLDSERLVDANASDWASYGLAPALLQVSVTQKDGKTLTLLIGENTPAGSAVYARLAGDPRLFTMPSASKTALDKDSKDLRDKRLLSFSQDRLTRLELAAKGKNTGFAKTGETEWRIDKPKTLRADATQLDELVLKLKNASMVLGAPDDPVKDAAAFASATPLATASVTDPTGTKTLEIRKGKVDYYAKSSDVAGVYRVGKDVADALDKNADDFRNKKLFDFGFNDPTRIEVTDGAKTAVYDKAGENWMSSGKKMDATGMQNFLDKLRDAASVKFVEGGSTTPVFTLNVVSNQGKRREKVEFYPAAAGGNFIARHDGGDMSFYEVDATALKDLRQAAADIREAQPEKKK